MQSASAESHCALCTYTMKAIQTIAQEMIFAFDIAGIRSKHVSIVRSESVIEQEIVWLTF